MNESIAPIDMSVTVSQLCTMIVRQLLLFWLFRFYRHFKLPCLHRFVCLLLQISPVCVCKWLALLLTPNLLQHHEWHVRESVVVPDRWEHACGVVAAIGEHLEVVLVDSSELGLLDASSDHLPPELPLDGATTALCGVVPLHLFGHVVGCLGCCHVAHLAERRGTDGIAPTCGEEEEHGSSAALSTSDARNGGTWNGRGGLGVMA
mmetsp:Transcript_6048/g.17252  ORF Transcript_6048/g.17252 Transcript_6048/m.17252 type:complete len:205 (+) Transcript_6048:45-659(+)